MTIFMRCLAGLATVLMLAGAAHAQSWPSRPIRWIVPYTPGGITDTVTRLVTQKLRRRSVSRSSSRTSRARTRSSAWTSWRRAAPDGYTLLTVIAAHAANATLYAGKLPFDPVKGFAPVSLVGDRAADPHGQQRIPAEGHEASCRLRASQPGKISFGSSGIGAAAHLTTELLKQTAAMDMVHVPYKGTAPALHGADGERHPDPRGRSELADAARARGQDQGARRCSRRNASPARRRCRPSPRPAARRSSRSTWVLFLAPAGTPREMVDRLSTETAKASAGPRSASASMQLGIDPVGSTPEQAAQFLDAEVAKWAKVITTAGVKAEQ